MSWIVVERVVDLGEGSHNEDQQYHDHADFLQSAHDSPLIKYVGRGEVLATAT